MRSPSSIASCQLCQPLFAFTRQRIHFPFLAILWGHCARPFSRKIEIIIIQHRSLPLVFHLHRKSCKQAGTCKCGDSSEIFQLDACECVSALTRLGREQCTARTAETAAGGEARTRNVTVCSRWLQQRQRQRYSTWSSSSSCAWHICAFDKHGNAGAKGNESKAKPSDPPRTHISFAQTTNIALSGEQKSEDIKAELRWLI